MLRLHISLIVPFVVLIAGANSYAQTTLTANLTNSQENPPTNPTLSTGGGRPASFGTATFTLNSAMTSMTFSATISNIDFTGSQTPDHRFGQLLHGFKPHMGSWALELESIKHRNQRQ